MLLYLMQHGANLPKEAAPDEPLSPIGVEQVSKTALVTAELGIAFDTILTSPKLRARETAEIMARATGFPEQSIMTTPDVKAMTPAHQTVERIDSLVDAHSVLIAGHMPNLAKLASLLITGDDRQRVAVQNSGLICIEIPGPRARHGTLIFSLTPKHIALMAKGVRRRI
jgi:phosphohistidine phosphatase